MAELDPRQERILRAVIIEYVMGAEPVGSESLADKYELGVKSATIRNELSELSELGFVEQPHTSAGRIPSEKGYRYYVDHLIVTREPGPDDAARVRGAADRDFLTSLLEDTTRALSHTAHLMAASTTLNNVKLKVRHAVLSALGPERALLVLVLDNGHVENRMIEFPRGASLEDIGRVNEKLVSTINGSTLQLLKKLKPPPATGMPIFDKVMATISTQLKQIARALTEGKLITHGEEFIFGQPEFQRDFGPAQQLMRALAEEPEVFSALASSTEETVNVAIGKENLPEKLRQFTVIRRSFHVGEDEAGTIAIIGPTRLNYDASIPLLRFTAQAISETLTKLYRS